MPTFREIITRLRRHYGKPGPPVSRNPFHLILWEQVAYLADDAQRRRAFEALRAETGLDPGRIASAKLTGLTALARMGGSIAPTERAMRMRKSAELVLRKWEGDLHSVLRLPLLEARRALTMFPMIGEPGADRILLLCGAAKLLALDSNALRVLVRLGLTTEARNYRATYRRAQEALAPSLSGRRSWLEDASALLTTHGKELCGRSAPSCPRCPLSTTCPFGRVHTTTQHLRRHAH